MQVSIADSTLQTWIFLALFTVLLLISVRKIHEHRFFDPGLTDEIKGFAILAVIFGHIGYFLSTDTTFLHPLSTVSGVGVNIFLFLSGLGLTFSQLKNPLSFVSFYRKRLQRLFVPMWIVLVVFLAADYFILGRSYSESSMIKNFLGWFPRASLQMDVNSPLWYFTYIFFYYLLFPLVWFKKQPYLSVIALALVSYFVVNADLPIDEDLMKIYRLHFLAFPLGVLAALLSRENFWTKINKVYNKTSYLILALCLIVFGYTAIYSGVGESKVTEQVISLITMGSAVLFFLIKKVEFNLLKLLGKYSYEIYLIHWPLMYRYDLVYQHLPASIATLMYLGIFLALGYLLQKVVMICRVRY